MKKFDFVVYTDGACSGNPGPGGYGIVIQSESGTQELGGYAPDTTNNRMELTAVIKALTTIYDKYGSANIKLISDSLYVVNAIQKGWLKNWIKHSYRKSDGSELPNVDLWKDFVDISSKHRVKFEWVKGHSGNRFNERCDSIAVGCIESRITEYCTF